MKTKKIELKYGSGNLEIEVPEKNIVGEVIPVFVRAPKDPSQLIREALDNPIGSKRLSQIARRRDRVCIVTDDVTRACPNHLMLPPVLEELRASGVKDEDVTIILALGTHRPMTNREIMRRLGEDITKRMKVINHSQDEENLVNVGKTSYGNEVKVNKYFIQSEVKILLGDVNYHYYAGYGGGRKSILPGISGFESINFNHKMLFHPRARTGVLEGNPVHEDMMDACRLVSPDFILNVVLNHERKIIGAFSGHWENAFYEAVKFLDQHFRVPAPQKADIVITSAGGYPKDINLYQGYKAMDNARIITKEGGVMIAFLQCREGIGHDVFYDWMRKFKKSQDVKKELEKGFIMGAHKAYYLLDIEQEMKVILFSSLKRREDEEDLGVIASTTPQSAIEEAFHIAGSDASFLILPYGYDTLPVVDTDIRQ